MILFAGELLSGSKISKKCLFLRFFADVSRFLDIGKTFSLVVASTCVTFYDI